MQKKKKKSFLSFTVMIRPTKMGKEHLGRSETRTAYRFKKTNGKVSSQKR